MSELITIREPSMLNRINELVAACWFHLDEIELDETAAVLAIPFLSPASERDDASEPIPFVQCALFIHHVHRWQIEETASMVHYAFEEIVFERSRRRFSIRTEAPIYMAADVEAFELSVRVTEKVRAYARA